MNHYKAYNLDASEFAQCLSGFEPILKNEEKIILVVLNVLEKSALFNN